MRIIPAIDIINGKCVRLTKGDFNTQKIYNENPLEVALEFEDSGIEYLHLVDLDGAKSGKITNSKILELITSKTNLKVDFGGGIKTDQDIQTAFDCGASQVTGGSIAVKNPAVYLSWLEKYGSERIILGADFINEKIATNGWQESSQLDLYDFILEYFRKGIRYVISTDISKDGMLKGPALETYKLIMNQVPVHLIASGGITTMEDLHTLKQAGCEGAIVGKAIYEGRITLKDLSQFKLEQDA
jgi:phosphoribosylformimino-5-aminoimidazole carboxamide ribotide isomerase